MRKSSFAAILIAFWGIAVAVWVAAGNASEPKADANVLSLGGTVTEIIYALGEEHRLVARDTTSLYPEAATKLPDVGYLRALSPEGVLSVAPELIISEDQAGPPEAITVLQSADIPFVMVPTLYSTDGIVQKIRIVGAALDVPGKADVLAAGVQAEMAAVAANTQDQPEGTRKKVLFILSAQGGPILASGTNTAADAVILLAGGENAVTGFEGYKPMTDEAITLAAPDVVLMMDRTGDHALTDEALFALPAMQATPAAKSKAIVRMNGLYLLGFGPRTAQAVVELNQKLYGP